jgi:hypothetical protein
MSLVNFKQFSNFHLVIGVVKIVRCHEGVLMGCYRKEAFKGIVISFCEINYRRFSASNVLNVFSVKS